MPKKTEALRAELEKAQQERWIVEFERPFSPQQFTGFVMGVGRRFFVLALLNDGLAFDQYICIRIKDIRRLQAPAQRSPFYAAARKARGEKMPRPIKLDLTDTESVVRSAAPSLLTIYREKKRPYTFRIGYALSSDSKHLELIEIDPDAKWESESSYLKWKQITRIDLPGPYEKTLMAVGGLPPRIRKKK